MVGENGRLSGHCLRIAAAGDIHCAPAHCEHLRESFASVRGRADLVLLAGDLTTHGEPNQGRVLAEACADVDIPVVAVLGNHDWHANRRDELVDILEDGGIYVLDRDFATFDIDGHDVGIVGVKGFVGGFPGSHLPDFGEPLLRSVYSEATMEVEALETGLREIALCSTRIVLMHYAPTEQTIVGEAPGIWAFLGTDRLAAPIAAHEPDLVLHGHAHAGTFEGAVGPVPIYNVSIPVIGRDFWLFELDVAPATSAPIH